ncbi:unnamed protein product [Discosporangium mesarthrocarpum]
MQGAGAVCNPEGGMACVYSISIVAGPGLALGLGVGPPSRLTVTASTAKGVSVLPCVGADALPDGLTVSPMALIGLGKEEDMQKNYELCAGGEVDIKVCSKQ